MNRVIEHSNVTSSTELLTLVFLANWGDQDAVCFYKNDTIGRLIRKPSDDNGTVKRILRSLKKRGELYTKTVKGRRHLFVTTAMDVEEIVEVLERRFELNPMEALAEAERMIRAQGGVKNDTPQGVKNDTPKVSEMTPQGVRNNTPKGVRNDTPRVSKITPHINPNLTHQLIHNDPPLQPASGGSGNLDEEIFEFLKAAGIGEPTLTELCELPHISLGLAVGHVDTAENLKLAIYRIRQNWPVPKQAKKGHAYRQDIPDEYADIIIR